MFTLTYKYIYLIMLTHFSIHCSDSNIMLSFHHYIRICLLFNVDIEFIYVIKLKLYPRFLTCIQYPRNLLSDRAKMCI